MRGTISRGKTDMDLRSVSRNRKSAMRIMTVYAYLTSYSLTLRGAEITIDNDVSWVRMDRNDQLYFEKSTV